MRSVPKECDGWLRPPARFRPAVLWSWNGRMSEPRIREMLRGFAARDMGGVFIHPRPGLVVEYLSAEWFDLWAIALEEAKSLGLECHIYDENSFPSGFAGGHVVGRNPLAAASRLGAVPAGCPTRLRDMGPADPADPASPKLVLGPVPASLWHGGYPMADVCRSEVARQFLEVTHDAYAARFQEDFGKAVRYVFTDEPEPGTSEAGYYLSQDFLRAFRQEHGYELADSLPDLCGHRESSPGVRHDYFETLNRLFTTNFARRCHDWCEARGLLWTGHYLENRWPFPDGCPSAMAAQRWMHVPGVDLLAFQYAPGPVGENALWLLTVKEAASVAAQCGRSGVLCESAGGGGYGYGPAQMKPLEDFLLATGVTSFAPHLAHESLAGSRKYDWPQTISDHSPWWDAYAGHARHLARSTFLLSLGTEANRILVIQPTTTGWLHYLPACFHRPGGPAHSRLEALRESHSRFVAGLYEAGIGFDLGDEWIMAELCDPSADPAGGIGRSAQGTAVLRVGAREYETVILPPGLENLVSSTADLLGRFLVGGGRVLCAGAPPAFIDGRPESFSGAAQPGWSACPDVLSALRPLHPPEVAAADGSPLPAGLLWRVVRMGDGGRIVFFANAAGEDISASIAFRSALAFDTQAGTCRQLPAVGSGGTALDLAPGTHTIWHVPADGHHPDVAVSEPAPAGGGSVDLKFSGCAPAEPNVLPLDYCDFDAAGVNLRDIATIHADSANWRAQGFDQNLWRVSIQYRRTFLEARVPRSSEFSVRYPFSCSEAFARSLPEDLAVAVERPWLYEISCNGKILSQDRARPWFDEEIRLIPVGGHIRSGANTIGLRARTFDVLAEIAPVILRGKFRAVPVEKGFRLDPDSPWKDAGDWRREGHGFYPFQTVSTYRFESCAPGRFRIRLPAFAGSAAGISLDGSPPEWICQPTQAVMLEAGSGGHTLKIFLCGHLNNLLGPHFHDGLPGAWTWENCPPSQPEGAAYRLAHTGVPCPPDVEFLPQPIPSHARPD